MFDISAIILSDQKPSLQLLIDKIFYFPSCNVVGKTEKNWVCDSWLLEIRIEGDTLGMIRIWFYHAGPALRLAFAAVKASKVKLSIGSLDQ